MELLQLSNHNYFYFELKKQNLIRKIISFIILSISKLVFKSCFMYSNIILSFFILLFLFPGQKIVRLLFFL